MSPGVQRPHCGARRAPRTGSPPPRPPGCRAAAASCAPARAPPPPARRQPGVSWHPPASALDLPPGVGWGHRGPVLLPLLGGRAGGPGRRLRGAVGGWGRGSQDGTSGRCCAGLRARSGRRGGRGRDWRNLQPERRQLHRFRGLGGRGAGRREEKTRGRGRGAGRGEGRGSGEARPRERAHASRTTQASAAPPCRAPSVLRAALQPGSPAAAHPGRVQMRWGTASACTLFGAPALPRPRAAHPAPGSALGGVGTAVTAAAGAKGQWGLLSLYPARANYTFNLRLIQLSPLKKTG